MHAGKLDGVRKFKRVTGSDKLQYIWEPPYSLNLTTVDPDIVYCLDIVRVTCGVREHVTSDCGIANHNYTANSLLDLADLYEATITPRSNIITSYNGTQVSIIGITIKIYYTRHVFISCNKVIFYR